MGIAPKICALVALLAILAGSAFAIRMSPAAFTAQNIPIGSEFDLRVPLVVVLSDGSNAPVTFAADPLKPSDVRESWLDGYEEIPDPNFLVVSGVKPVVAYPDSPAIRPLLTNFPFDSSFFNRHFLVQLRVMPTDVEGMFQTVLVGSYLLETTPTSDRFTRPGGFPFSIGPSILYLDKEGKGTVRVYNNDSTGCDIELDLAEPPKREERLVVELSEGYERGDPTKFKISKNRKKINGQGYADLDVSITDKKYLLSLTRNTEIILWGFDSREPKSSRFVRIHYRPE